MKRCLITILAVALLIWSLPATAFAVSPPLSLGVSPSHTSVTVTLGGSTTVPFTIYYYTGDVQVTAIDLPVAISPSLVSVSDPPYDSAVMLTSTSSTQGTYNGYLRFQSVSGSVGLAVSMAVQVEVVLSVTAPDVSWGGGGGYVPPITTAPPAPTTEPVPVPEPTPEPTPTIPPTMPAPIPVPTPVPTTEPLPTPIPEPTFEPTSTPEPPTSTSGLPTTEPPQVAPPDIIDEGISTSMWFIIGGGSLLVIIGIGVLGSYAWKRWRRAG